MNASIAPSISLTSGNIQRTSAEIYATVNTNGLMYWHL